MGDPHLPTEPSAEHFSGGIPGEDGGHYALFARGTFLNHGSLTCRPPRVTVFLIRRGTFKRGSSFPAHRLLIGCQCFRPADEPASLHVFVRT